MRGGGADGAWEVPGGGRLVWHLYTLPFGCALRRQGLAPAWLVCGIYICTIYLLFWLCHLRRQGNNISLDAAPLHPPCIRPASALFDDSVLLLRGSLAMAREAVHGFRLYFVLPWGVLACAPMISSADPLQTADACKAALPACLPACYAALRYMCCLAQYIFGGVFFVRLYVRTPANRPGLAGAIAGAGWDLLGLAGASCDRGRDLLGLAGARCGGGWVETILCLAFQGSLDKKTYEYYYLGVVFFLATLQQNKKKEI